MVPDSAPPYDDELAANGADDEVPDDEVYVPGREHTAVGAAAAEGLAAEDRTVSASIPARRGEPAWPSQFAQVLAETLAGSRPQRQMVPWTTERARSTIRRLGPTLSAGQLQRPRVRRVVTSRPADNVMEMTVVVGFGPRVRALAVRLERADARPASPGQSRREARWLCTAFEAA
ncbi:MAG TPA: Rv3235 family protein [Streptosporangiaceae bacterium]|jgi:hypothetical protein|nr:Rv3235 family protein [Streptosporangiaceae bacterium]